MLHFLTPFINRFSKIEQEEGFALSGRYSEELTPSGTTIGSGAGFVKHTFASMPWYCAVPDVIQEMADYEMRYYCMLRFILVRPLRVIMTPNPSTVVTLLNQFKKYRTRLISEIESGILDIGPLFPGGDEVTVVPPEARPDIAARLRSLPDDCTLSDLWPQLSKVATWQDGGTSLYLKRLQELAPSALLVRAPSGATEGSFLTNGWEREGGCCPALLSSFFEFLPKDAEGEYSSSNNTLTVSQLELGHTYRLVMSSDRGYYRYLTDDIFRVVGQHLATPMLRYAGRFSLVSSLTGEKLTEQQISEAIQPVLAQLGPLAGIQAAPEWGEPPRYVLLIEPENLDTQLTDSFLAELSLQFDEALMTVNEEYASKRKSARLERAELVVLAQGQFARMRRESTKGRSDAQHKQPVLTRKLVVLTELRLQNAIPNG